LILLVGVILVAAGVVCLYLSDAVARPGSWWQGTLDGFGVGLVIGGLVDATTITLLTLSVSDDQLRATLKRQFQRQFARAPKEP
jgi:hypothetical protein